MQDAVVASITFSLIMIRTRSTLSNQNTHAMATSSFGYKSTRGNTSHRMPPVVHIERRVSINLDTAPAGKFATEESEPN